MSTNATKRKKAWWPWLILGAIAISVLVFIVDPLVWVVGFEPQN